MSRKTNPRRAAASVTILSRNSHSHETDTNSEDDEEWQSLLSAVIEKSKVTLKRKTKSTPKTKRSIESTKRKKKKNTSKLKNSIVHLDSDSDKSNDVVSLSNIQKNVESKVDNFFKSSRLISDDEEDVETTNIEIKLVPKESKEFYTLSDSDDEIKPTTSTTNLKEFPVLEKSSLNSCESIKIPEKLDRGSKDDLMELVDEILDCDPEVPIECNTEQDQSWSAYKNKTEEILGSVSALLDDLKRDNEKPKEIISKNNSAEKCKPSCPICLENFGESVTAAATMCGHIFCQNCINHVAKTSKKCPTCRKAINLKKIHPVYL